MTKKRFDFEASYRLGIDEVDNEHIRFVDMLNHVYALLDENKQHKAAVYFSNTLSNYIDEHLSNEEDFMRSFNYPDLEKHKIIHRRFQDTFATLKDKIKNDDGDALRKGLQIAFSWLISHIGTEDKKYTNYYMEKQSR